MKDELTNEDDYRVTYKYKKRNRTIYLSNYAKSDVNYEKCQFDATHVVTELIYGFDAFLVFEKTIKNHTKRKDIGGKTFQS